MKKSVFGVSLIIAGTVFGFFAIVSFVEIQASIEYFKTLPVGSSQPISDYSTLYRHAILSVLLIASGIIVYIKTGR